MEEIEIGAFRITLPRAEGARSGGVVEFQVFGQVPARERDKVAKALTLNAPELRYRVVLAVRSLSHAELEEPNLHTLRASIAKLANAALEEKVIRNVGFYQFSFTTH